MDIATIIGFALILISLMSAIFSGGDLGIFIDLPSLMIVGFGVLGGTFIKWPIETVKQLFTYIGKALFFVPIDTGEIIDQIGELAETARRESIFALEKVAIEDPFLKKAMTLAADNRPPEVIQAIMKLEIEAIEERHRNGRDVLGGIGQDGPAFGMMGTLVGLVIMLQNLSDPSSIGPAMAVALLTTFYGVIIANAFALPMGHKLGIRSAKEQMRMSMIIAGTLGIVAGENPRLIKEKLNSFLPTHEREEYYEEEQ